MIEGRNRTVGDSIDIAEVRGESAMTPQAVTQALRLLARWAARRAGRLAREGGGEDDGLVTGVLSNVYKLNIGRN